MKLGMDDGRTLLRLEPLMGTLTLEVVNRINFNIRTSGLTSMDTNDIAVAVGTCLDLVIGIGLRWGKGIGTGTAVGIAISSRIVSLDIVLSCIVFSCMVLYCLGFSCIIV